MRFFAIVTKRFTKFRDRTRQDVVGDERVGPDSLDQTLFEDDVTWGISKANQDLHDFWFDVRRLVSATDGVELRLDEKLTDSEEHVHDTVLQREKPRDWETCYVVEQRSTSDNH